MTVATNVRPGRTYRTLLAHQSAKGTTVNDFTSATQLWANAAEADFVNEQVDPEWYFNYHNGDFKNARYGVRSLNKGVIEAHATPALVRDVLQSLFGTYAGSTFTIKGYVNKWASLAFVEDKTRVATSLRVMRLADALFQTLMLEVDSDGYVEAACHYAAEADPESTTLGNLAALSMTLPTSPMDTTDRNVFPGRSVTLWRDPLGANVRVPFERLTLSLDVNLDDYWDMMGRRTRAIRRGPITTELHVIGKVGDEMWQAALDSNDDTKQTYRVIFTEPVSGHVLTFTLYEVSFNAEPYGIKHQVYDPMQLHGVATQDLSGNFVGITLT